MAKKQPKQFVKSAAQQCSRLEEISNLDIVFDSFKRHYKLVPLEVFGKDPYKTLISTLMSARTRDEVTLKISKNLFKVAPDLKTLKKLSEKEIKNLIHGVGFYKTKAKHLYKLAQMIDKVPN